MIKLQPVKCSIEEQETTIQISRDGNEINLYTSDNLRVTKMQKLINAPGTTWRLIKTSYNKEGEPTGYFFVCSDKIMLTLRPKKAVHKPQTEEMKEAARARMKKLRAKQSTQN